MKTSNTDVYMLLFDRSTPSMCETSSEMATTQLENCSLNFCKYQGTGNDFVCIDNRKNVWQKLHLEQSVSRLCDRRYGIGADGIILIQDRHGFDFQMVYFNADGSEAKMCGNGGRCAVAFAKRLGIIENEAIFLVKDGPHEGRVDPNNNFIRIKMVDVDKIAVQSDGSYILNTGIPHYVRFVNDLNKCDIVSEGRKIRYSDTFKENGINVNFVNVEGTKAAKESLAQDSVTQNNVTRNNASNGHISVRTYERGVENETFSCGTGATASALAFFFSERKQTGTLAVNEKEISIAVSVTGGELLISFDFVDGVFTNIFMCGPAEFVFKGKIRV